MVVTKPSYKLAIVAPTCLYYQVSLYQTLAAHPRIDLMVYFCSEEALNARDVVKLFNTRRPWTDGEELLVGYNHKFMRNYSPWPSYLRWPFGLMNFGIWNEIRRERPDAVVVMGWTNLTWWVAILASLRFRTPLLYMNDANVQAERSQPIWKKWIKKVMLGGILFRLCAGFLSSGTANDILYKYHGVPENKLVPFAYSLVHQAFLPNSEELRSQKNRLRTQLGVPEKSYVVLFSGRLIKQKGPFDLLEAYRRINLPHKALIIVGDGEVKQSMLDYVTKHDLDSVYFFGFQNREEIGKFYAISDVLVLPSWRETWGMVVNEAMCFALPIIVSDQVGARDDLVQEGYNGFSFHVADVAALTDRIQRLMELPEEERLAMGARSLEIIKKWSQKDIPGVLVGYLDSIYSRGH